VHAPWKIDPATREGEPPVSKSRWIARVLIAGVGYRNLRDLSIGPVLIDQLKNEKWPTGVEIEDLSYGPVGVMHNFDDRSPYDKIIFLAGVSRNRKPGQISSYRWRHELPDPEEIQARMGEAVTGVVSLDNLLIISTYFKKLPEDVVVIEVEPADETWGEGFTQPIEEAIPMIIELIRQQAGVS
jgi:hydrogenase maturation protease